MNFLCTVFGIYDFDYSTDTESLTFHYAESTENVTALSTGRMKVGIQVHDSCAKVMLLDACHGSEAML